jgi:hypothetical protein
VTPAKARREQLRVPKHELAARIGVPAACLQRQEAGGTPLSSRHGDLLAMLLGADGRELFGVCACGCGQPATRTYRNGHNRRGKFEEHARALRKHTRDPALVDDSKACEGCGRTMLRGEFAGECDAKWLARRCCSRRCNNAAWRHRSGFHLAQTNR